MQLLVRKYLKANGKVLHYTNSERQKILELIGDSLNNDAEMNEIIKNSGYTKNTLLKEFEKEKQLLSEIIRQDDGFGSAILSIYKNDEQINQQYIEIAKTEWLKDKSEEKRAIEDQIESIKNEKEKLLTTNNDINRKIKKQEEKITDLEKTFADLKQQKESVTIEIKDALSDFNGFIGKTLVTGGIISSKSSSNDDNNVLIRKYDVDSNSAVNVVDDPEKAIYIMRNNLTAVGIKTECAISIAKLIYSVRDGQKSFVVTGKIARSFSDALSYSIDGKRSTIITMPSTVNYKNLYCQISNIEDNVLLFENVIDSCDELDYTNIVKDFPNKILVFSVDNVASLSLMSKNIWNYSIPIIAESIIDNSLTRKNCIPSSTNSLVGKVSSPTDYDQDLYFDSFANLSLPLDVCRSFNTSLTSIEYFNNKKESISTELVDSIYAFFCSLYEQDIDEDDLERIKASISESIRVYYMWQ